MDGCDDGSDRFATHHCAHYFKSFSHVPFLALLRFCLDLYFHSGLWDGLFAMRYEISLKVAGYILSLLLTLAAYFIILHPNVFNSDITTAMIVIFALALIQSLVQLIFFINVWREEGTFWNISVFASTVSIIFIIIFFSIWIMNHLNYNMVG